MLVEPMDEARARIVLARIGIEQTVDMARGLGAALRGEAGWLIEDEGGLRFEHYHVLRQRDIVVAQGAALALWAAGRLAAGRDADDLAGLQPIVGLGALAVHAYLAGARPFAHRGKADLGQMPLEPAVEPDALIVRRNGELAYFVGNAHAKLLITVRPNRSALMPSAKDRIA